MSIYPLKFKPRYVQKMWGGCKLQSVLHKSPPDGPMGESWEIFDFPPGVVDNSPGWISSEVANGPLAGKTLHELVQSHRLEILGDIPPLPPHDQFPLLIKFLDAREDLSVQVHPDEAYARANPGAHLKNEAWFVVQADPGSRLLIGLRPGTTRAQFESALKSGSVEATINAIPIASGDCYYLPSGTVHALGAGVLAAEVQTPSDTTYRVFDFNRVDPSTGKTRKLHIEQALKCIDFAAPLPRKSTGSELVKCDHFSITRKSARRGEKISLPSGEPIILMFLAGSGEITGGEPRGQFAMGDTFLIPASLRGMQLLPNTEATWLEVRINAPE